MNIMKLFNIEITESLIVGLFAIFIISSMLLFYKPAFMFTENGQFKKFGTGNKNVNTLFPFWLVISILSSLVYFLYTLFY